MNNKANLNYLQKRPTDAAFYIYANMCDVCVCMFAIFTDNTTFEYTNFVVCAINIALHDAII